jgi:acyl-CoA synthetase (AMP-forming)/AMP-acid ligase II
VIAVPAYPPRKNRSLERIRSIVTDSGATIVLTTNDIQQTTERSFSDVEELKGLHWLVTNPQIPKSSYPQIPKSPNPHIPKSPNPPDVALLQYTSGSTGQPKGVMVSHLNLMRNLEFLRTAFELDQDTVAVHWLPVFHDMGLVFGVLEPIFCGYTGILMPPVSFIQKPVRWLRAISDYRATLGGAPNFAYDLCVSGIQENECEGLDLSCLKTLYNGAEPVRKLSLEAFSKKFASYGFKPEMFYPTYGMAEATLILAGGRVQDSPFVLHIDKSELEKHNIVVSDEKDTNAYSQVSVGWPRLDTEIITVNPETFEPCDEDQVGEIWVSGSIVTNGYWNNPAETDKIYKAFTRGRMAGPYLRTGDLGFYHRGHLFISGRLKDLIIIRGRNYYPQDIEFIAESSHPALRANACAAFSIELNQKEKLFIAAEVERTAMHNLDAKQVCEAIRINIAEEFELEVFGIVLLKTASIFKTSSGKIQRKACRQAFLDNKLEIVGESLSEPQSKENMLDAENTDLVALRAWLMVWIHTYLKIPLEKIDLAKPILVYGLSSMKAVQLQQEFLDKYGVNFPPYMFFERISVNELAERAHKLIQEG